VNRTKNFRATSVFYIKTNLTKSEIEHYYSLDQAPEQYESSNIIFIKKDNLIQFSQQHEDNFPGCQLGGVFLLDQYFKNLQNQLS